MTGPDQGIAAILRAGGKRPMPGSDATRRAREATFDAWQKALGTAPARELARHRVRWLWLTAAASFTVGVAVWQVLPRPAAESVVAAATIERVTGPVALVRDGRERAAHQGTPILAGTLLESTASAQVAVRLASGHSLRMDSATRLRWIGPTELSLEQGRIYVDSGLMPTSSPLRLRTPLALLTDVGTQFQVAWLDHRLRVSTREGTVAIAPRGPGRANDAVELVGAGEAVIVERDGAVERRPRNNGDSLAEWTWIVTAGPGIPAETKLSRILEWVCRELGLRLRYRDAATENAVRATELSGELAGLSAPAVLDALRQVTRFDVEQVGQELRVSRRADEQTR